jgi:dolichol-phosphate mannosyltransferase
MKTISLCYAVYQNAGSLEELYLRSRNAIEENFPELECEFVFVNDGSTDGSLEELKAIKLHHADERIKIISFTRNFGQMAAIVAGWQHAAGDAAINLAADLQDPPEQCVPMIKEWLSGKNVVISYRDKHATSWFRILTSKIAYRTLLPHIPVGGFDFTLLSRRALEAMLKITERNRFYQYDVLWIGFSPVFIPYEKAPRKFGRSQYSFFERLAFFTMAYVNSSYSPLRLMATFGVFFALAGFSYAAVIVYAWLMHRTPFEGWAPIMVLMLVMGGFIMIMLGILGEYLWRVLDESKRRPFFLVKDVS